jgi:hypothetical protein
MALSAIGGVGAASATSSASARGRAASAGCNPLQQLLGQCSAASSFTPIATVAVPPTTPTCGGVTIYKSDGTPWQCTFDDEFDASTGDANALDTNRWTWQTTEASRIVAGDSPSRACYVNSADNVNVADGTLNLSARREPFTFKCSYPNGLSWLFGNTTFTTQWTAAQVMGFQKFSQTYGKFEVRAKLPQTTAVGLQETFWLWPDSPTYYGAWPKSGEIDFAEFYSPFASPSEVTPYIHYGMDASTRDDATGTNVVSNDDPVNRCAIDLSAYNTYGLEWTPGTLTVLYNGNVCFIDHYVPNGGLTAPAPFDQPFFLSLTQALGVNIQNFLHPEKSFDNRATAATPDVNTTKVEWVRIWR